MSDTIVITDQQGAVAVSDPASPVSVIDEPMTIEIRDAPTSVTLTDEPVLVEIIAGGPRGAIGPRGPKGDIGGQYLHEQPVASAHWNVVHDLGFYPNVTVIDSAKGTVFGDVTYVDLNSLVIDFAAAFAGEALLS